MFAGTKVLVEVNGRLQLGKVLYNRTTPSTEMQEGTLISIGVVLESGYCIDVDPTKVIADN
jgi:hypothetical protein